MAGLVSLHLWYNVTYDNNKKDEVIQNCTFGDICSYSCCSQLGYSIYPSELKELHKAVCSAASHTYSCAPAPVQYASVRVCTVLFLSTS